LDHLEYMIVYSKSLHNYITII